MRLFACEAKNESSRNTGAYARGNKKSGMKQKDIAKAIGVSAQTVSKYMKADIFPALDTFAKLCALLDVSSDHILGIKEF